MKATAKIVKTFPKPIQTRVAELKKRYRTRNVSLKAHTPDWQMYIAEGASYYVWHEVTEKGAGFRAQHSDSLHAGGPAISHEVGSYCPAFPSGTWVVEFELFCGKPFIVVHTVKDMVEA